MTHPRGIGFMAVLAAAALACGGGDETPRAADIEQTVAENVAAATGTKPSEDTTPCEILDDGLVRAHFEVGDGVEITRSLSKYSSNPLCTVRWAKPNAENLEKERAAAMSEYMQRKLKGEDVKMPSFRTNNEVTLTLYEPPFESSAQALQSFDSAMKRLSEGMTGSHEDVEVTFQADVTPVTGVGRKAMWAPKMRQLSVVTDDRIFHLGVNTGAELDAELDKARAIAQAVARKL